LKSLDKDLPWLEKTRDLIVSIAQSFELDPSVVAAVISRESGGGRLLGRGGCPPDTGDGGHGRGLMQIDDRWHADFLEIGDFWRNPAANIAYGCWLLKKNLLAVDAKMPGMSEKDRLRIALAGYNCGLSRAMSAAKKGNDIDAFTTGLNYSSDVLKRAEFIRTKWLG